MFWPTLSEALYPEGHPYSWPTIGSMEDLSAAEVADVEAFFRRYYAPNNAVITLSGDVDPTEAREIAERLFGWIPAGEPVHRPAAGSPGIPETRHLALEDRVTLPQVNLVWRGAPAYSDDSPALDALADILGNGKNSRLYKRLVYDEQRVQSVSAFNWDKLVAGDFMVRVTARADESLTDLESAVLEEVARLAAEGPTEEELARVVNGVETGVVMGLETAIGRAERLQRYYYYTGEPDYAAQELARYRALTPADVQAAAGRYLDGQNRIVISVVPEGSLPTAVEEVGS
jgi:zinc protease